MLANSPGVPHPTPIAAAGPCDAHSLAIPGSSPAAGAAVSGAVIHAATPSVVPADACAAARTSTRTVPVLAGICRHVAPANGGVHCTPAINTPLQTTWQTPRLSSAADALIPTAGSLMLLCASAMGNDVPGAVAAT